MMNYEKMTELFQNEDFQKEAEHFGTMEDFRKGFARYGLDLTEDEVADIIRRIAEKKLAEDQG